MDVLGHFEHGDPACPQVVTRTVTQRAKIFSLYQEESSDEPRRTASLLVASADVERLSHAALMGPVTLVLCPTEGDDLPSQSPGVTIRDLAPTPCPVASNQWRPAPSCADSPECSQRIPPPVSYPAPPRLAPRTSYGPASEYQDPYPQYMPQQFPSPTPTPQASQPSYTAPQASQPSYTPGATSPGQASAPPRPIAAPQGFGVQVSSTAKPVEPRVFYLVRFKLFSFSPDGGEKVLLEPLLVTQANRSTCLQTGDFCVYAKVEKQADGRLRVTIREQSEGPTRATANIARGDSLMLRWGNIPGTSTKRWLEVLVEETDADTACPAPKPGRLDPSDANTTNEVTQTNTPNGSTDDPFSYFGTFGTSQHAGGYAGGPQPLEATRLELNAPSQCSALGASKPTDADAPQLLVKAYVVADLVDVIGKPILNSQGGRVTLIYTAQPNFSSLIERITSTVEPASWQKAGGQGSMAPLETNLSLVVRQTAVNHKQIEQLLEDIRGEREKTAKVHFESVPLTY